MDSTLQRDKKKTYSKSSSAAPKTKLRLNKIYERTA